jgi:hypothetical protein
MTAFVIQGPGRFRVDKAGRDRAHGDADPAVFSRERTDEAGNHGVERGIHGPAIGG